MDSARHTYEFLGAIKAAEYLGIDYDRFKRICGWGEGPPYYSIGKLKAFDKKDLDAWLASRRVVPKGKENVDLTNLGN